MKYTVDRIEGDFAVCESESGEMTDIPLALVHGRITEGCILTPRGDGYTALERSIDSENKRLFDSLFKNKG